MISNFNLVKFTFLKCYVMSPTEINLFGMHSPCKSRLQSGSENVCHPEFGKVYLNYIFCMYNVNALMTVLYTKNHDIVFVQSAKTVCFMYPYYYFTVKVQCMH